MEKPAGHLQTLDALRGIAAIAVMVFHAPGIGARIMPGGYVAVDLFFMLSGVVIAHAYQVRMAGGLTPREFLMRRAIRLWPMLAIGALLGMVLHGGHAGSLFLLPNWKSESLFPANPPMWSLLMEAIAYAAFAFGLWRARPKLLVIGIALAGGALTWLTLTSPYLLIDFGAHWPTLAGGLLRVGFGFGVGMLLWHIWTARERPSIASNRGWFLAAVILAAMAVLPQSNRVGALLAIAVLFPAITWLALCWEVKQPRIAKALGDLSYPLYCIHLPLLFWVTDSRAVAAVLCFVLPAMALGLERWVDRPACKWLANLAKPKTDQTRIGIST